MKKFSLIVLATLLSLCLASCGTGGTTPNGGSSGSGNQKPIEQPNNNGGKEEEKGNGDIELPPIDF